MMNDDLFDDADPPITLETLEADKCALIEVVECTCCTYVSD
jgi:hypothetical protein